VPGVNPTWTLNTVQFSVRPGGLVVGG
jgi:hypothetical protein